MRIPGLLEPPHQRDDGLPELRHQLVALAQADTVLTRAGAAEPVGMRDHGVVHLFHARVLIGHGNPMALAELAIGEDFSVRQLEEWVRQPEGQPGDVYLEKMRKKSGGGTSAPAKDADTRALERRLTDALGLEVSIDHRGEKGTLSVKYTDLDQLDAVVRKLGG